MSRRAAEDERELEDREGAEDAARADESDREAEPPTEADSDPDFAETAVPPSIPTGSVDDSVKRRLEEAYLNDIEDDLIVVDVTSPEGSSAIAVEMSTPHGETSHTTYFDAPEHGTLEECAEFLEFLEVAGVSPLELDDLIGARIPAAYDPDEGWVVGHELRRRESEPTETGAISSVGGGITRWSQRNADLLVLLILVGGELLLAGLLIYLFA